MSSIIDSIDAKEKPKVFAAVAKAILPNPAVETLFEQSSVPEELQKQVLAEIRTLLDISTEDSSNLASTRIYDYLTKEIRRHTIRHTRERLVKQRIGGKGLLPPSLYSIKLTDYFKGTSLADGVSQIQVQRTIAEPFLVQHLSPSPNLERDTANLSLYVGNYDGPQQGHECTLLVITTRKGDEQQVYSAWIIFHPEVEIPRMTEPLQIFKSFVDVYGLYFRVGESLPRKFVLYDAIVQRQTKTKIISIVNPENHDYRMEHMIRVSSLNVIEVAMAFCIDVDKYRATLKAHGIAPIK